MPSTKHVAKRPQDGDRVVAERIRALRKAHGMTLAQLAVALGISKSIMHKYEAALCRVGASRLHQVAEVLGVPVSHFFPSDGAGDALSDEMVEQLRVPGALELLGLYTGTSDPLLQQQIRSLVETSARLEAAAASPNSKGGDRAKRRMTSY